jgi:predicted transcriptional regulator
MNRAATKQQFKARGFSISGWCRVHNICYSTLYTMLQGNKKMIYTRNQVKIMDVLKREGLYVPSDDELEERAA